MAAEFYTADELQTVRDKAVEIAAEGVASFLQRYWVTLRTGAFLRRALR